MKVFILGMPLSGRSTVSKALSESNNFVYINPSAWIKESFRAQKSGEHIQQYNDEYHRWLTSRLKIDPTLCSNVVLNATEAYGINNFIIDGIFSPKDFIELFDYNEDYVVFLNRTDSDTEYKDYESIGVSVMRDYCFWLASANLLPRKRWVEYNFKIPGQESDSIKELGSKNCIFLVKSLNKVINHLQETLSVI